VHFEFFLRDDDDNKDNKDNNDDNNDDNDDDNDNDKVGNKQSGCLVLMIMVFGLLDAGSG